MAIAFACDFCTRRYKVDDALGGKRVKCKECGTEIAIPAASRALAAARPAAPPRDLYGLDDEDEAPLPPPRRAGMEPDRPRSRSRRGGAPANADQLRLAGIRLLIFGAGAFVLPFVGLQWAFLHFMPPLAQFGIASLLLLGGIFCLLASSVGPGKALVFSVLGGVVGIPALLILLALILPALNMNRAPNNPGGQANAPNMPPPMPNFNPPPNPFAPPAAPANGNPAGVAGVPRVVITGGKSMPGVGRGVTFEIEYRFEGTGLGGLYDLYIKSSQGMTKIVPPVQLLLGRKVNVTVLEMNQGQGPFEAHFEEMSRSGAVSNSMTLPWADAPPQQQNNPPPGFGPNRGFRPPAPPRMPRFGPGRR